MNILDSFISHLEEQVKNHSIYVWGAQGQQGAQITEAWIRRRENSEKNAARAIAFWKKQVAAGYGAVLRAFDCSGLGMYWLQNVTGLSPNDRNANSMMGICKRITKAECRRGDWVFHLNDEGRATHIGYIIDDDLNVIECKGRDDGVVKRPLKKGGWEAFGRPKLFEAYIVVATQETPAKAETEQETQPEETSEGAWIVGRLLKLKSPYMRGDDVRRLQEELIAAGFDCGKCGADGVFGKDTDAAVKAYQAAKALEVDGIAGRHTITALGGVYEG